MDVPFDTMKYEEEKLESDIKRFQELLRKYKDNIDEVLEFAELYTRLVHRRSNNKYI